MLCCRPYLGDIHSKDKERIGPPQPLPEVADWVAFDDACGHQEQGQQLGQGRQGGQSMVDCLMPAMAVMQ
jgi:hypothetical protein